MAEAGKGGQKGVDLMALSPQHLEAVKQQLESEVNRLSEYLGQLQVAHNKFVACGVAIKDLGKQEDGQSVLVPLTSSLYVPGTLAGTQTALVDIGTGYLVEKTAEQGEEYSTRKTALLRASMEKIADIVQEKRRQLGQVDQVLRGKLAALQQAMAKQQAGQA